MKKFLPAFILLLIFALSVIAQTASPEPPKTAAGSLIKGKAILIPKPAYPRAAQAVHAGGAVLVQVLIDEEGNVISADALSGHPLLRLAAVTSALQAKFSPTLLQGKPIKVAATLTYNFVSGRYQWVKLGFALANLEKSNILVNFDSDWIRTVFQKDWENELKVLSQLEELKQIEATPAAQEPDSYQPPSSQQIALTQSLMLSVQERLAPDPVADWKFKLGIDVSRVMLHLTNPAELQDALKTLRTHVAAAPDGVSPEYMTTVQSFLSVMENPKLAGKTLANLQASPSLQEILEN